MLFYKLVTAIFAVVMLYQVSEIRKLGTSLRRAREAGKPYDEALVLSHRGNIACLGCVTFLAVALIEFQVRMSPDPYAVNPWLFGIHLTIDILMISIGALMLTRFTGKKRPHWHRRLAYSFAALFVASMSTGTWMLVILPN